MKSKGEKKERKKTFFFYYIKKNNLITQAHGIVNCELVWLLNNRKITGGVCMSSHSFFSKKKGTEKRKD